MIAAMQQAFHLIDERRGIIVVSGEDRVAFLQGLVSNDVRRVAADRAVYAALLTPQGRYLHDFFIAAIGDALYLDCEAARREDLRRRLSMYKLRAKVALADVTEQYAVALLWGADPGVPQAVEGACIYLDPRLPQLGARAILPRDRAATMLAGLGTVAGKAEDYERLRLSLGVPDGSRDLPVEKALLLENGFDELNGVDWQKGCYIGQELTARTKYRGLVKKRLLPVTVEGPLPAPGTPVMRGDEEAGELRSGIDGLGLALLRLDHAGAGDLTCGGRRLQVHRPAWIAA